jgi:hypothetical protein
MLFGYAGSDMWAFILFVMQDAGNGMSDAGGTSNVCIVCSLSEELNFWKLLM